DDLTINRQLHALPLLSVVGTETTTFNYQTCCCKRKGASAPFLLAGEVTIYVHVYKQARCKRQFLTHSKCSSGNLFQSTETFDRD
ncbi:MAG: hypothetical protein IJ781_13325, partial [Atopobiaceae bacterium]|nr:hypothetical protein [Atopobiaceae bacterium]